MYCGQCGKENKAGTNFCIYCGAKLNNDNVEAEKSNVKPKTYYEVLEITQDASPEIIKAAYKVMVKKYHPDNSENAGNEKAMMEINLAYEVLSDVEKRRKYDEQLKEENRKAEEAKFKNNSMGGNSQKQQDNRTQQNEQTKQDSGENSKDELHMGTAVAMCLGSGILFSAVQNLHYNRWVIFGVGFIFMALVGYIAGRIIVGFIKKSHILKLSIWGYKEHEKVESLFEGIFELILFSYLGLAKWISLIGLICVISMAIIAIKSLIAAVFD